ncbi:MAG: response regulator, partial [Nodosilinea sp.]
MTKLFVIDDDLHTRDLLTRLLSQKGYQVESLATGQQAVDKLTQIRPSLVLLDILLPDLDGYRLCQELKANPLTQDIPIIFLSSLDDSLDRVKAFQVGAADYIAKPFASEEVLVRVQNQLHLASQRQQLNVQNTLLRQEVEERIQVEQALLAAEMNYRSLFENSTVGIFKASLAGTYLSVNPAMAHLYGYDSAPEMVAAVQDINRQIYVQPKRRDELVVYLNRYERITDAESEVFCKNGSTLWVSEDIWKVWDREGNFLYYEGIVHDISERRQIETELRQQRQQADRLLVNILPHRIAQRLKSGNRIV